MTNRWKLFLLGIFSALVLAACNSTEIGDSNEPASTGANEKDPLVIVWYPNESGAEMGPSRDAFGELLKEATGRDVEHKLTTDYAIAIETIANGNGHIAFMGAQGYIEAKNKNENIIPLVVPSGASGTLEDARYFSWLAVPKEKAEAYKDNGEFSLNATAGKSISFVSASSTSGFKVPTSSIIAHFSDKNLTQEQLMEGNEVYPTVLFGDSHQGSAVNMLMGRSDVAAFCDTCVSSYVELIEGEANKPGSIYKVRDDAAAPFNTLKGKEFTLIQVTPVLNAPFAANKDVLTQEEIDQIVQAMTSDETANNTDIFKPKELEEPALFTKSEEERFVQVEDAWFNPIRELSK